MNKKGSDVYISKISSLLIIFITFIWAAGLTFILLYTAFQKSIIKQSLPQKITHISQMMNATEFAFINRFGVPQYRQTLGQTNLIQYRNPQCVMAIYLSPQNSENKIKISQKISLLNRQDLSTNNNCLKAFAP